MPKKVDIRKQAKAKREKGEKLWKEHVELLKQLYPKPNLQDEIQVSMFDIYPKFRLVLETSFPDFDSYSCACNELGWPYSLESEQIAICQYCDAYYYQPDGVREEDTDDEQAGTGFCKQECLEYYQIKRQEEVDQLEYDYLCFPDQYEVVDGQIYQKARTPEQQKAFRQAWERAIEKQKESNHEHPRFAKSSST